MPPEIPSIVSQCQPQYVTKTHNHIAKANELSEDRSVEVKAKVRSKPKDNLGWQASSFGDFRSSKVEKVMKTEGSQKKPPNYG